jgi:hypothetical protein
MQDYLLHFFFIYLFFFKFIFYYKQFGLSTELLVMFDFVVSFLFNCYRREMISLSQLRIASESIVQLRRMLNDDDWMWLALLSSRTSGSGGIRWYPVSDSGIRWYPVVSDGIRWYPASGPLSHYYGSMVILAQQKEKSFAE